MEAVINKVLYRLFLVIFVLGQGAQAASGNMEVKTDQGSWVVSEGDLYLQDKDGQALKGWHQLEINGKTDYYYFSRTSGKMVAGKTVDGIKLDKSGRAELTDYNQEKIETMITAREKVESLTEASDSKEEKMEKCFEYLCSLPYIQWHMMEDERDKEDWDLIFANDVFEMGSGDCIAFSAAYAYMLLEIGYTGDIWICGDTRENTNDTHAWTELRSKGKETSLVFDVVFANRNSQKEYDLYYKRRSESETDVVVNGETLLWRMTWKDVSTGKTYARS